MAHVATLPETSRNRLFFERNQAVVPYVSYEGDALDLERKALQTQREWSKILAECTERWAALLPLALPDDLHYRGVDPVHHDRTPLFTRNVTLNTASLPKWKPRIVLSRRDLEDENA